MANIRTGAIDAVLLQRTAVPPSMARPLLAALKKADLPYLLDLDDDLLNVPAEKDPQGSHAAHAPVLRDLVAHARVVTVSTPELLSAYCKLNPNVHLLPNRLSGSLWAGPLPDRRTTA